MPVALIHNIRLHYEDTGPSDAPTLVFSSSLGTDFRLWDAILPLLPKGLRIIRYDMRGHGLSSCPDAPYYMGDLVADIAGLLDHLKVQECVFVGLSVGGIVAQGLAAERMDLVRALVLSNTAVKIGTFAMWEDRMQTARKGGIEALADATIERWFSNVFRRENPVETTMWRSMMTRTPLEGFLGVSAAISETDLFASTALLTLPTLAIAGSEDGSTPPDLVREISDLIKGAHFHLIRGAGHLPCVEKPDEYAKVLTRFLRDIGHI